MTRAPISVGQLTSYIAELFQYDDLLTDLWVDGEITSVTASRAGHYYFKLADGNASLSCVLFQGKARQQTFLPEAGSQFILHGNIGVYESAGAYQLYVDVVQPTGLGLLALEFARLRIRLLEEGLFEPSRKRPIPTLPRVIGVVTSKDGAVWHDIQTVVARRYPLTRLLLSPTLVQGAEAPQGIVNALQSLLAANVCDVIILSRGGGSAEDLAAFNDERVVRAVFASSVPVISAIGHETDWTLCDEVADVRAATPSAAAEMATPAIEDLLAVVEATRIELMAMMRRVIQASADEISRQGGVMKQHDPRRRILAARSSLDHDRQRLRLLHERAWVHRQHAVETISRQVQYAGMTCLQPSQLAYTAITSQLRAFDPLRTLARGYAVLETQDGKRVRRAADLQGERFFDARLFDGVAHASLESLTLSQDGKQ